MKRKIFLILTSITLMACLFLANRMPALSSFNDEIEIYLNNYSSTESQISIHKEQFALKKGIKGEACVIKDSDLSYQEIFCILDAKFLFVEQMENQTSYYGYSPKIKYFQIINGQIVNVHVAIKDNVIKIGCPIIYGSF